MSPVTAPVDIRLKSILMATDFSSVSNKPLRHALAIARRYGSKLYLVNVVSSIGFNMVGPEALTAATEAVWRDAGQLEAALEQNGQLSGIEHELMVRQGNVWEELEKVIRQERIDMVVAGTHARHGLGKLLLGSVAEQIFRRADCLVLTVGPGSSEESPVERTIRPFLFPIDFSEASLHALPYAISAANLFGTRLILLHAIPEATAKQGFHRRAPEVGNNSESVRLLTLRRLEQLLMQQSELAIRPELRVESGSPTTTILRTARDERADAIIMGLRRAGYLGAASHMPWATAYEVVNGACCSVLTVRN